ncbi:MAG: DUF996 domain-containing protein [Brevinematia bacterium]
MQKRTRIMGGVGLILTLSGMIPKMTLASLIGMILLLVAYNWLSKEYQERKVFSKALAAFLIPFLGSIALAIVLGIFIAILIIKSVFSIEIFNQLESGNFSYLYNYLWFFGVLFLCWIVVSILMIISGTKWKEADYIIAEKSGEGLFRTAGDLIYIGSLLFFILIGSLVILVGIIIKIIAFFSVKETE